VRPRGQKEFGTRVELKNINSFRFVSHAVDYEVARLIALAEAGKTFKQHTRQWSEQKGVTEFLREKEGSDDYRYFPDPDLPPLVLGRPWIEALRAKLPQLPDEKRASWVADLKLPAADADVLTSHPRITAFFEGVVTKLPADAGYAKRAANFVMTEVLALTKTHGLQAEFPVNEQQVAALIALVANDTISSRQAKEVFAAIANTDQSPEKYVSEHKMEQVTDVGTLEAICQKLIDANPKQVASFKAGKTNVMGFFVGQVMKETKSSASPALVNKILSKLLSQ
jgi:aspartyl-tRNA(Asn)/glutamyl-tRNA(Gln) amidotransferase subunit B